jgi:hypothetical protein
MDAQTSPHKYHMQTPNHSTGFHCHTFDTQLLEQVIAVEVESAVRRLCCQRGIACNSIDQHAWTQIILKRIHRAIERSCAVHMLLPSDIDARIDTEICRLVDEAIRQSRPVDTGSMFVPVHGLLRLPRHAGVLLRKIFEKHIE